MTSNFGSRATIFIDAVPVNVTHAWQFRSPFWGTFNLIWSRLSCLLRTVPRSHMRTPSVPSAFGSVAATVAPDGTRTCTTVFWTATVPVLRTSRV